MTLSVQVNINDLFWLNVDSGQFIHNSCCCFVLLLFDSEARITCLSHTFITIKVDTGSVHSVNITSMGQETITAADKVLNYSHYTPGYSQTNEDVNFNISLYHNIKTYTHTGSQINLQSRHSKQYTQRTLTKIGLYSSTIGIGLP